MKVKPKTWEVMKDSKKEPIKTHKSFENLMGFTNKLDGGDINITETIKIILKEGRMKNIIKKILKEDRRQMFLNKIIKVIKNDFTIIKNLKDFGFYEQLSEEELNYVLSGIFGEPVTSYGGEIYDENNNRIYFEDAYGDWEKYRYDERGKKIYQEDSYGVWKKIEYDNNGNIIYREDSNGMWFKKEFDEYGNQIYHEDSTGRIMR